MWEVVGAVFWRGGGGRAAKSIRRVPSYNGVGWELPFGIWTFSNGRGGDEHVWCIMSTDSEWG